MFTVTDLWGVACRYEENTIHVKGIKNGCMMTSSNGNISVLLAICAGNSPVPGEFPTQKPVTRSFDVFFDLHLNKRLSKQSWGWWLETLSRPLGRHCNGLCALWRSKACDCDLFGDPGRAVGDHKWRLSRVHYIFAMHCTQCTMTKWCTANHVIILLHLTAS